MAAAALSMLLSTGELDFILRVCFALTFGVNLDPCLLVVSRYLRSSAVNITPVALVGREPGLDSFSPGRLLEWMETRSVASLSWLSTSVLISYVLCFTGEKGRRNRGLRSKGSCSSTRFASMNVWRLPRRKFW